VFFFSGVWVKISERDLFVEVFFRMMKGQTNGSRIEKMSREDLKKKSDLEDRELSSKKLFDELALNQRR